MPDQFGASSRAKTNEHGITMPAAYIPEESDEDKQDNQCIHLEDILDTRETAYVIPCTCAVNNGTGLTEREAAEMRWEHEEIRPVDEHANQRTHQCSSIAIYLTRVAQLNAYDIAKGWNPASLMLNPLTLACVRRTPRSNRQSQCFPPSNNYADLLSLATGNASTTTPSSPPFPPTSAAQEHSIRNTAGRALTTLLEASLNPIPRLATRNPNAAVAALNGRRAKQP
ncbi:hypothetical protein EW146_g2849 [Bondarzewia mesenterica]|uniref:Uncharacterized protein n=1 Tax=Bondarzewia mesenterica TaxID=1095465 RepID=A0A4S4LZG7_9AGAM|nr:hypothetical protein EW146_g2849 [Bondarzewia mesenterica]